MSLENEINRLKRAKTDIRASLKTKIGLDIPEETKLDEYAKCIDDVESTCPHINGDFYSLRTNNGTNYSYLFENYNGTNLDYISNWDTSSVTNMSYMFHYCVSLTSLDLSNFDTSKVTNMYSMFNNCRNLTSLDLSNFNTSNVKNMDSMFNYCVSLTSLNLSNFDTSQVTNMNGMFYYCARLISVDITGWDTAKVTNMNSMFYGSSNMALTHVYGELDLSGLTNGFYPASYSNPVIGCKNLETLYLKNIYKNCTMTNATKWSINLGATCITDECLIYIINELPNLINDKKLTSTTNIILTLPQTNTLSAEQVKVATDKGWQVANTTYNLTSYNVTYNVENIIYTEKLIAKEGMPFKLSLLPINNGYAIESVVVTMGDKTITPTYTEDNFGNIAVASINITSVTGDINIVAKAKEVIKYTSFTVGTGINENNTLSINPRNNYSVKNVLINGKPQEKPTGREIPKRYTVKNDDEIKIGGEFKLDYSALTSITNFELQSNVTSINNMFSGCRSLTLISFSDKFDTSNVTNMSNMFSDCYNLTSLNLSSFDTRNVTSYSGMLSGVPSFCKISINSKIFINKNTGKTFTPSELDWYGTFTDLSIILPPEIDPIEPPDPKPNLPA